MSFGDSRREILVVSFGTSDNYDRNRNINAVEYAIEEAFTDWKLDRAYTNFEVINKLKKKDGIIVDTVEDAIQKANNRGVNALFVQPSMLVAGPEYMRIVDMVDKYADAFRYIEVGDPLLSTEKDYEKLLEIIVERTDFYDDEETAICLVGLGIAGHGSIVYSRVQEVIDRKKYENYYVATLLTDEYSVDYALEKVKMNPKYKKVLLVPFMLSNMDNIEGDSKLDFKERWTKAFEENGYKVEYFHKGLGSLEEVQNMFIAHVAHAMDQLG